LKPWTAEGVQGTSVPSGCLKAGHPISPSAPTGTGFDLDTSLSSGPNSQRTSGHSPGGATDGAVTEVEGEAGSSCHEEGLWQPACDSAGSLQMEGAVHGNLAETWQALAQQQQQQEAAAAKAEELVGVQGLGPMRGEQWCESVTKL
jgi:hypothetical protein